MIRAVDNLDAVAQALGINTDKYQKAVKASSEGEIKRTAEQLTAGIDLTGLHKAIKDLPGK